MNKLLLIGLVFVLLSILALPHINEWERVNNYPFGKLCEVYNSCK